MKIWIASLLLMTLPLYVQANSSEEPKVDPATVVAYVGLFPALVGNFGTGPRLKFFKADVSLRVTGAEAEAKVVHHQPLIRNQLVMLFSQQTDETMAAADAKETLRQAALKQVQDVLVQEEGAPLVEDLLFNNLIIQ
ncbi:flagellar FliL protein [Pseudomonas cuatrocienegasensis]|uniref:Flagellar protein FliL n=1 Tax=Pseudomonas cuatrocienegasensis TaxID=543360 RepID=A0ABY1B6G8_9PSED|nr:MULTISPECIES: flagellar basal body-associated protein FliL [Pseudomonas]SEQ07960.1 flagellar FliL protein [Pseudomonas cuatrocienegasensis]